MDNPASCRTVKPGPRPVFTSRSKTTGSKPSRGQPKPDDYDADANAEESIESVDTAASKMVPVDTSNWKFVATNLTESARNTV